MISATDTSLSATTTSSSSAAQSQTKLSADLNSFLKMLTTQLQNQDPLSPLDTNQFTEQLVQFSSVEQQIQQNEKLEQLINIQQQAQSGSMVNYLGHTIEVAGNQLPLQGGSAGGSYVVPDDVASVKVLVKDGNGNVVRQFDGDPTAGRHDFTWDGTNDNGDTMPDGVYQLEVDAVDKSGGAVSVDTSVMGRVTGAGYENGNLVLLIDDAWVNAGDIVTVRDTPTTTTQD